MPPKKMKIVPKLWLLLFFVLLVSFCTKQSDSVVNLGGFEVEKFKGLELTVLGTNFFIEIPITVLGIFSEHPKDEILIELQPDLAKAKTFEFSVSLPPRSLDHLEINLRAGGDVLLGNSIGSAFLVAENKKEPIGYATIVADRGPNFWLEKYKHIFKNKMAYCEKNQKPDLLPESSLYQSCYVYKMKARIVKLETARFIVKKNFPKLLYLDIFVEILEVR